MNRGGRMEENYKPMPVPGMQKSLIEQRRFRRSGDQLLSGTVYSWSRILYNLRVLRRNVLLSSSELGEMQAKRLRGILEYAYENVPFYRNRLNAVKRSDIKSVEDLRKIPTLTKSEVQRRSKSFIAEGPIRMFIC